MPWAIRDYIDSQGVSYTVPPKSDGSDPWPVDWYTYKERHLVECFFQKLKWFRPGFPRYEKLDASFLAFICTAAISIMLKQHNAVIFFQIRPRQRGMKAEFEALTGLRIEKEFWWQNE